MRKVLTSEIQQGMVLAKPVKGPNGNVLLNAGAELQGGMGHRLQSWGIPVVYVDGDDPEEGGVAAAPKADPAEVEKSLSAIFSQANKDPLMQMIYQQTFAYLIGKDA